MPLFADLIDGATALLDSFGLYIATAVVIYLGVSGASKLIKGG